VVKGSVIVEKAGRNVVKEPECIKLWDSATGKERATLIGHPADVPCVIFSPDDKTLACGREDGTIKLWDVANARGLVTFKGHTRKVTSLAFSADSGMLLWGAKTGQSSSGT
jgi:WD40 repeat protein